jgi:hypothetical protein
MDFNSSQYPSISWYHIIYFRWHSQPCRMNAWQKG